MTVVSSRKLGGSTWKRNVNDLCVPFASQRQQMLAARAEKVSEFGRIVEPIEPSASTIDEASVCGHPHSYSYSVLRFGVRWPSDVDPQHREQHLCRDEFMQVMGMRYSDFAVLPVWRQADMKRERSLF